MGGNGGSGFGGMIQQAISQLPNNMQNYVGGPSYPGMQKPGTPATPGGTFNGGGGGSAYQSGAYNQLASDMRGGNMGRYSFGGGMFGYSPFGGGFGNPYYQQPWMGGQQQPWSSGPSWQQMPQRTQPFYGGYQGGGMLPYSPMNRSLQSATYAMGGDPNGYSSIYF